MPTPAPELRSRFASIARWCLAHRWQTFVIGIAALIVAIIVSASVSTKRNSNFRLSGTESQRAYDVLAAHSLAAGPGVNPLGDEVLAELGEWWSAGPCVERDVADG